MSDEYVVNPITAENATVVVGMLENAVSNGGISQGFAASVFESWLEKQQNNSNSSRTSSPVCGGNNSVIAASSNSNSPNPTVPNSILKRNSSKRKSGSRPVVIKTTTMTSSSPTNPPIIGGEQPITQMSASVGNIPNMVTRTIIKQTKVKRRQSWTDRLNCFLCSSRHGDDNGPDLDRYGDQEYIIYGHQPLTHYSSAYNIQKPTDILVTNNQSKYVTRNLPVMPPISIDPVSYAGQPGTSEASPKPTSSLPGTPRLGRHTDDRQNTYSVYARSNHSEDPDSVYESPDDIQMPLVNGVTTYPIHNQYQSSPSTFFPIQPVSQNNSESVNDDSITHEFAKEVTVMESNSNDVIIRKVSYTKARPSDLIQHDNGFQTVVVNSI